MPNALYYGDNLYELDGYNEILENDKGCFQPHLDGVPHRGAHPSVGVERPRSSPPDRTQRSGVQRMKRFLGILLVAGSLLASAHAQAQLSQFTPPAGTFTNQYGTWTFGSQLADGDYQICLSGTSTNGAGVILQSAQTSGVNVWTNKGYWQSWNGAAFSSGAGTAGQSCTASAPSPPTPPASSSPTAFGVQPIASPYPLQMGFTPITSLSQITGSGNYQLTANISNAPSSISITSNNVAIDGAGFSVSSSGQPVQFNVFGSNVLIRNFIVSPIVVAVWGEFASQNNVIVENNLLSPSWVDLYYPTSSLSNVSFIFNTFQNASDDLLNFYTPNGQTPVGEGFVVENNIFNGALDACIEGVGQLNGASIVNNAFYKCSIAIGGWYSDPQHDCCFEMFNTSITGNVVDSSTVTHLYDFPIHGYSNGDQDATMAWGYGGTAWPAGVLDNIFIGNVFASEPLP